MAKYTHTDHGDYVACEFGVKHQDGTVETNILRVPSDLYYSPKYQKMLAERGAEKPQKAGTETGV